LSGCVCAPIPDIPSPDGSTSDDGGPFGVDGGAVCRVNACPPGDGGFCAYLNDGGRQTPSCIEDTCLTECGGGRACAVEDAGRCLSCGGSKQCAPDTCVPSQPCTFIARAAGCVGLLDDGSSWQMTQGADCRVVVSNDAGVILGSWFNLGDGAMVGTIPRLGGACTGHDLFTNLGRLQLYCPYCSFVAEGCE
jgi:hypothetical protein